MDRILQLQTTLDQSDLIAIQALLDHNYSIDGIARMYEERTLLMSTTTENLNKLFEARSVLEDSEDRRKAAVDAVLTAEIKDQIKQVNDLFANTQADTRSEITRLEFEIKASVAVFGETVKANKLMAVFVKGRQSWDNKDLDIYAEKHPEILPFRKIGTPSVVIKPCEKKD